jgi:hypothetical protein
MKKYFFLMMVCLFSLSMFAQVEEKQSQEFNSVVGVSPFRLWNGLRLKYERVLTPKITYGGVLTGYFGSYPGVQLAPNVRYYFKGGAPEGFYAQAKVVCGLFFRDITVDVYDEPYRGWLSGQYPIKTEDRRQSYTNFGAGIAAGYQLFWGKDNRWSIDINLGVKIVSTIPEPNLKDTENVAINIDNAAWLLTGPGSIADGLISIGYRF